MRSNWFITFTCLIIAAGVYGEIQPRDNALIHHNSVFLEEEPVPGAKRYELSYRCLGTHGPSEELKPAEYSKPFPAFVLQDLQWASRYFWRVRAFDANGRLIAEKPEHTFQVMEIRPALTNFVKAKLDIQVNTSKNAGGFLAIDYTRTIYDRNGQAVWALPDIPGLVNSETQVRDLKLSVDNTITFLTPAAAVEIDFEANVLWKTPTPCLFEKDTLTIHHDFKKTKRGTYLVLVSRRVRRALPPDLNKAELASLDKSIEVLNGKYYKWTPSSLLLEFDKQGKIIWYWDSDTYLKEEDLAYKKNPNGSPVFLSHANAFSENEQGTHVYIGFRDLSRIVKVNKANKKVEYSFGEKFPSGEASTATALFRRQHDATITKRNTLLIFNNNEAPGQPGRLPNTGIVEIKDQNTGNDKGLVWRYDLDTTLANWSSGGGNISELPNGNLILCTGVVNRILEVDRKGNLVWEARVLGIPRGERDWQPLPQYRVSWMPQLSYYYVFATAQPREEKDAFSLLVLNMGSNHDAYTLEWINENKVLHVEKLKSLAPGESRITHLPSSITIRGVLLARLTSEKTGQVKVYNFQP